MNGGIENIKGRQVRARELADILLQKIGQAVIDDGRQVEYIAKAANVNRNLVHDLANGRECNPTLVNMLKILIELGLLEENGLVVEE